MIAMILSVLPMVFAALFVWDAVADYRRAVHRGKVKPSHYWHLGFTLYNAALYVTWGWLLQVQWFCFYVCLGGFLVSMAISMYKEHKAKAKAFKEYMAALDAKMAQNERERKEIVSALDLIEHWEALSIKEFAARHGEIEAGLQCMEATLQRFDKSEVK